MKKRISSGKYRFLVIVFLLSGINTMAQTDVEFWFVAPEITIGHGDFPGGEPVYFRVSALDLDAMVRIYQPANPSGLDTTFIVPANTTVSIDASPWIDDLENTPGGLVLNKGVLITSTNLITVYYDEDEYWNQDIFALKGRNALGLEFYTPFNEIWNNGSYTPTPFSSIDIVATEDNTTITITPTADAVGGHTAGVPFTITLNKGQTYSVLASSQSAAGHLGGTHIVADKPIAVTLKDDSVAANVCRDLIGDQTVPLVNADGKNIVGYEYIVMRGKINLINPSAVPPDPDGVATGERIYVMATEPNTDIYLDGALYVTLASPGMQAVYEIRNNSTHVEGSKPIMVLHTSGFGCELGGAVLPTIDGCTGSVETSFTRSTDRDFYLNILTEDRAKDGFTMYYEDGTTFDIPGSWFEPVGTTGFVTLKKANKYFANNRGGGVPQGEVVKVRNTVTVFHLGLIEGGRTSGCKYGYFSDYSVSRGDVLVVETGSKSVFRCFGDTIQLRASGAVSYEWSPTTFLNDPYIATPIATPPPGVYNYDVTLNRGCFGDTTITVILGIADQVESFFTTDKWYICAPDTVTFDNLSFGVDKSSISNVQWDFDLDDPGNPFVYDTSASIQQAYENTTDTIISKTVQLLVWNSQSCLSEFRRDIVIRPEIDASFDADVTEGCQPVTVNFDNTSTGNLYRYKWDLGDGNSSKDTSLTHTYLNYGLADSLYQVEMVTISPFYCSDTAREDIWVYPYLEASFTTDTFRGCSPLVVDIENNSAGYIEEYEWTFGDGATSSSSAGSLSHSYTNTGTTPVTYKLRLVVKNNVRGCTDTLTRNITVYPEVTSQFTQDQMVVCNGSVIAFTNQSSSTATIFQWDFGDGGSSSTISPGHLFENMNSVNEDYEVRLVSTTPNLCRDTSYQTIRVHPYIHAEYALQDYLGCAPFLVDLQNASEGAISNFNWNWGDGTPPSVSADTVVSHTYQNTGLAASSHDLILTVRNADGCTDTMQRSITVLPEVVSQFTQDETEGCNELTVTFTNQSGPSATSFLWEFGDGTSSHEVNPVHTFRNTGANDTTYTVRLVATSDGNCGDTSEVDITVYSFIRADFTFNQETFCSPFDITFNNSSIGGTTYEWDFGDGNAITLFDKSPVTHTFSNPSPTTPVNYNISLTVLNTQACASVFTKQITVMPSVEPDFEVDIDEGCHPLSVNFTNNSTGAVSYVWDFGNGESSDEVNPSMEFENFGASDTVYNIVLMATNSYTCRDSFSVPVTVHPIVSSNFAIEYERQCAPAEVNFVNSSVNGFQYDWDFNGTPFSTSSKAPINRQFENTSTSNSAYYQVGLHVTSAEGCTAQRTKQVMVYHSVEADFTSITEGCTPLQVSFSNNSPGATSYEWDFGDNSSSILENPVHLYTNFGNTDTIIDVRLISVSENFCTDSAFTQVTVYPGPRAKFSLDKTKGCSPLPVTIENLSDPGNNYTWTFGDGTPPLNLGDTQAVEHTYWNDESNTQVYTLKLDVTTPNGCQDTIKQKLTIFPTVSAEFEWDTAGCSPHTSEFLNTSANATSFIWDFGDGNYSYVENPGHTFLNEGVATAVYDIVLESYSDFGCGDTITKQVSVYPTPVVEFSYSPVYQYFPKSTVVLDNQTNDGMFDFEWDFDDGTASSEVEPGSYTYAHWGEYDIRLKASNAYCADSVEHWLKIFPPLPVADFTPDVDSGCMPLTVTMTNHSLYGESYFWEFDDGTTSTEFEPVHVFEESGIYQVKLSVTGEGGMAFDFRDIEVFILPEPDFHVEPRLVMLPDDLAKGFNSTKYGASYLWDFGDGTTYTDEETSHLYTALGIYDVSLTAWTEHGCEATLLIPEAVEVIGEGFIKYPSVFRPNPSGPTGGYVDQGERTNNVFYPITEGVVRYHLMIYNRWGELMFETHEINQGWDGYYNGKLCPQGVYVFKVTLSYTNDESESITGDVTLLHKPGE